MAMKRTDRDDRGIGLGGVVRDLRFAARQFRQRPLFGLVVVVTFALGIAATTVISSLAYAVLLRPLPYPKPRELVTLAEWHQKGYSRGTPFPNYADWRRQSAAFSEMAALTGSPFTLERAKSSERLVGQKVTGGFFALLAVPPLLGRWLNDQDDRRGADPVVVVSHALWQRVFAADPHALGQTLNFDGLQYTVVGVMPAAFASVTDRLYSGGDIQPEVWTTLKTDESMSPRGSPFLRVVGRLKAGITAQTAGAEMALIGDRLAAQFPAENENFTVKVRSMHDDLTAEIRPGISLLFAAVGLLFVAACVTVANLLLVRSTARLREFALRAAIGADRRQLLAQSLVECGALATLGALLGVGLACVGLPLLRTLLPASQIPWALATLSWPVLLLTAGVSWAAGVAFGAVQALQVSKVNLNDALKSGGNSVSGAARSRVQRALVVLQVSLAFGLIFCAALVLVSFVRVSRVDPGFDPRNVVTAQLSLPWNRFRRPADLAAFYDRLLARLSGLPEVERTGGVLNLPLCGIRYTYDFEIEGRPKPVGAMNYADYQVATPGYFAAMRIRLLSGRLFTDADDEKQPRVAVINQTMAETFWPAGDALGKRFKLDNEWRRVIGIVGSVHHTGLGYPTLSEAYFPHLQHPWLALMLAVRTRHEPAADVKEIREAIAALDPSLPIPDVRPLSSLLSQSLSDRLAIVFLLDLFAGAAVGLAALGLYGTLAFTVGRRTREIGIRMVLGEPLARIRWAVLQEGLLLSAVGVGLGVGLCFALTQAVESQLYGVKATDPEIFTAVAGGLIGVALLSCWLPAAGATRIEPVVALRHD
jgi:predicted permease